MPIVVVWIGRMLLTVAGEFLIKALVGSLIGVATYTLVVSPVRSLIAARFQTAGVLADYIGFLGIDVAVTIVLSALAGRAAISSSKAFFVKRAS